MTQEAMRRRKKQDWRGEKRHMTHDKEDKRRMTQGRKKLKNKDTKRKTQEDGGREKKRRGKCEDASGNMQLGRRNTQKTWE